jgi:hypothetical protein
VDTAAPPTAVQFNQELHDELIGMRKRDQSEQADGPAGEGAAARTERLQAIIRRGANGGPGPPGGAGRAPLPPMVCQVVRGPFSRRR